MLDIVILRPVSRQAELDRMMKLNWIYLTDLIELFYASHQIV
jgi:hypothetical protein